MNEILQPGLIPQVCINLTCTYYGSDDLGKATSICDQHIARSIIVMAPPPRIPHFMQGWEACEKVWAAWLESDAARKQREYEAEIERQHAFVDEIAKTLR